MRGKRGDGRLQNAEGMEEFPIHRRNVSHRNSFRDGRWGEVRSSIARRNWRYVCRVRLDSRKFDGNEKSDYLRGGEPYRCRCRSSSRRGIEREGWWSMSDKRKERCATCRWWDGSDIYGRCHASPPTLVQDSEGENGAFPRTWMNDFCGRWEPIKLQISPDVIREMMKPLGKPE